MSEAAETTWWLDHSGLPDLLWARLRVFPDGTAEVFDLDGHYFHFPTTDEAVLWLNEDEYQGLDSLIEDGDVEPGLQPPQANSDPELKPKMLLRRATS
jgi:hypothetical protein